MRDRQSSKRDNLIALTWCLAWGSKKEPQYQIALLEQMRHALRGTCDMPAEFQSVVDLVQQIQEIDFPENLEQLLQKHPGLCGEPTPIGLVYGGATKIKGYVFEAAKLQDIRGASALLDRINLLDLPAFFGKFGKSKEEQRWGEDVKDWLNSHFPGLSQALCPELVIYSSGGNILAFCPAAFVGQLADAIELRYTTETLTANSCAVGRSFRLLEFHIGLLKDLIKQTFWLQQFNKNSSNPAVTGYYGKDRESFANRKSFNELVGVLASDFNRRRNGNETPGRLSRCFPPMFETHPYLRRDETERSLACIKVDRLPGDPLFSEPLARKRVVGQLSKRTGEQHWYEQSGFMWKPGPTESWVAQFERFLEEEKETSLSDNYYGNCDSKPSEARSLQEIGDSSSGFVGYIYADGNNLGGYIQKILTATRYRIFSEDVTNATMRAVYIALARHLHPHLLSPQVADRNGQTVHPFEILTIGGDDVLLIVPANRALEIAKTIGEEFERILGQKPEYQRPKGEVSAPEAHRYRGSKPELDACQLSISSGVLIAGENTPIYYAQKLVEQLLKSAKKRAKELKKHNYCGGTVDFLSLKSVTMLSDSVSVFRKSGLTKKTGNHELKLYAAPYTLHELSGLLDTIRVLKKAQFPMAQLYQIRSLLEQGKNTAILNYRYFRVRLSKGQKELENQFEKAWCEAKSNNGNLAPWMSVPSEDGEKVIYETIWRDLVDLHPFVEEDKDQLDPGVMTVEAEK